MPASREPDALTPYGWLAALWVLLGPFQYGWHISVLNQVQAVASCRGGRDAPAMHRGLPTCIPMGDAAFSAVTAVFCFGGLAGSLLSEPATQQWGRRGATRASALMFAAGSAVMGIASSLELLVLGRFLVGVGAGGLSVAPVYIAELAPKSLKGLVGVLNQMSIVLGIMITQMSGFALATPTTWRLVLLIAAALGGAQFVLGSAIVESPAWLRGRRRIAEADAVAARVWKALPTSRTPDEEAEDPLLERQESDADVELTRQKESVSITELIRAPELRRPLFAVGFMMLSQQISGINAVLYYSNAILSKSLPDLGPYVSIGITVVNVAMTIPPIFLIERLGRKQLLYSSAIAAVLSLLGVGIGLNTGNVPLSSIAIVAFVMAFAIGLGPVPFVLIPEISPFHAVGALSSFGLSLHWVANWSVGQLFLPLRNALSGGDPEKEGRVFYVFAAALATSMFAFSRLYR